MADGAAFHGNLEMEERAERDFPVSGKVSPGTLAEIPTVLPHPFNFRQQGLFNILRVSHSVPPLVKSGIIPWLKYRPCFN